LGRKRQKERGRAVPVLPGPVERREQQETWAVAGPSSTTTTVLPVLAPRRVNQYYRSTRERARQERDSRALEIAAVAVVVESSGTRP